LRFKKNLYAVRRPYGNASSKKVRIFRPYRAYQSKGRSQNWPIIFVATTQTLSSLVFKDAVDLPINKFDHMPQVLERRQNVDMRQAPFSQKRRQVIFGVLECHVGRKEANATASVSLKEKPNPPSQNRADQDVRIEDDHVR